MGVVTPNNQVVEILDITDDECETMDTSLDSRTLDTSLDTSFRSLESPPPYKKFKASDEDDDDLDTPVEIKYDRCKICKVILDEHTPSFNHETFKADYAGETIKNELSIVGVALSGSYQSLLAHKPLC